MQPQVAAPDPVAVAAYRLCYAIDAALAHGITATEVQNMVDQRIDVNVPYTVEVEPIDEIASLADQVGADGAVADADSDRHRHSSFCRNDDGGERIYLPDEVPDGLIDLPSASRKYGIAPMTLYMWVCRKKLPRLGRVRAPAAGGGYILTLESEIPICRDNPRKSGPKKHSVRA